MEQATKPNDLGLNEVLMKAIGHPMRLDLLRIFGERVASPVEAAAQLNEPVGNVAYHVRKLEEYDCIELVSTRPVRGATEHFYRAVRKANVSDELARLLPRPIREEQGAMALREIFTRVAAADRAGTLDARSDRHISWMPLTLDEEGWKELVALKASQLEAEVEIQARAAGRLAAGAPEVPVFTATLAFEAP